MGIIIWIHTGKWGKIVSPVTLAKSDSPKTTSYVYVCVCVCVPLQLQLLKFYDNYYHHPLTFYFVMYTQFSVHKSSTKIASASLPVILLLSWKIDYDNNFQFHFENENSYSFSGSKL